MHVEGEILEREGISQSKIDFFRADGSLHVPGALRQCCMIADYIPVRRIEHVEHTI